MSNIENMRERIITSLGKVIDTAKTIEECNPGDKVSPRIIALMSDMSLR